MVPPPSRSRESMTRVPESLQRGQSMRSPRTNYTIGGTAIEDTTICAVPGQFLATEPPLLGAPQAGGDGGLRRHAGLPGHERRHQLLHPHPGMQDVQMAALPVDERLLVIGRPVRQARDAAAALGGDD